MRTTLIILEGPDGAGKSTLVECLLATLKRLGRNRTVVLKRRAPVPSVDALDEYVTPLLNYRPGFGEDVICDRWHIGELVYPHVYGRRPLWGEHLGVARWIELFLQSRGALLTYVHAQPERLAEHIERRRTETGFASDFDELALKHNEEILNLFNRKVRAWSSLNRFEAITDEWRPRTFCDDIVALATDAERSAARVANLVTYVGSPTPRVLLLGDVRQDTSDDRVPAFAPRSATSGLWLMDALERNVGFEWWSRGVGLVNVNDVDDPRAVRDLFPTTRPVTLGSNAYRAWWAVGGGHPSRGQYRTFGAVTHPQYARRFHNHFTEWYVQTLRCAYAEGTDMRAERPDTDQRDVDFVKWFYGKTGDSK